MSILDLNALGSLGRKVRGPRWSEEKYCSVFHMCVSVCAQSCPTLCNPMAPGGALQAPLFMGFSRQEY